MNKNGGKQIKEKYKYDYGDRLSSPVNSNFV